MLIYGVLTLIPQTAGCQEAAGMEITPKQFSRIEHCLPLQRGNVSLTNQFASSQRHAVCRRAWLQVARIAQTVWQLTHHRHAHALGYPGRASLTAWVEELHPELRVRLVGHAERVSHSTALKQAAVIALCTRQGSAETSAQ